MIQETFAILSLGFAAGFLHAFDADHIAAVSSMHGSQEGHQKAVWQRYRIPLLWSLGHGCTLLLVAFMVFLLGMAVPDKFVELAEKMVGILLLLIGAGLLVSLWKQRVRFTVHHHKDGTRHAHFHHQNDGQHRLANRHKPVFVGMVHGAAGSAPVLALFPFVGHGEWAGALGFVVLFSLAVALAMTVVGHLLEGSLSFLEKRCQQLVAPLYGALASCTIGLGVVWLQA